MDFEPESKQMRVLSVHAGVSIDNVQENTGFDLLIPDDVPTTPEPTADEIGIIAKLDPNNMRLKAI